MAKRELQHARSQPALKKHSIIWRMSVKKACKLSKIRRIFSCAQKYFSNHDTYDTTQLENIHRKLLNVIIYSTVLTAMLCLISC